MTLLPDYFKRKKKHETGLKKKTPPALSPFEAALLLPPVRIPRHFPFTSLKYFPPSPPLSLSPIFERQRLHFSPCCPHLPPSPARSGSSPSSRPSLSRHLAEDFCDGILPPSLFDPPETITITITMIILPQHFKTEFRSYVSSFSLNF